MKELPKGGEGSGEGGVKGGGGGGGCGVDEGPERREELNTKVQGLYKEDKYVPPTSGRLLYGQSESLWCVHLQVLQHPKRQRVCAGHGHL